MSRLQKSETLLVGMVLALAAGMLDAYTYLVRSGVFASLQTGNIIFTAIALAEGNFSQMWYYLASILSFTAGVFITECIRGKFMYNPNIHWRQIVLVVEVVVIALSVLVPSGELNYIATCMIAFVCAMQIESFRKINGAPAFTTIMTGALRSATQNLYNATIQHDKHARQRTVQYLAVIASFVVGVVVCYWLIQWLGVYAVLGSAVPLLGACILMRRSSDPDSMSDPVMNYHGDGTPMLVTETATATDSAQPTETATATDNNIQ